VALQTAALRESLPMPLELIWLLPANDGDIYLGGDKRNSQGSLKWSSLEEYQLGEDTVAQPTKLLHARVNP
jgi:hypothetical protein